MGTRRTPARTPRAPGRDRVARLTRPGRGRAWRALAARPPGTTAFIERYRAGAAPAGRDDRVQWSVGALRRHHDRPQAGRGGRRGHQLLRPPGRRVSARREDALERAVSGRGSAARGVHHHAAARQEPLADALAGAPGGRAQEAILAWQLERTLGKRRILELYLNVAELGRGATGSRRRRASILRQVRGGRDAARGGAARGQPAERRASGIRARPAGATRPTWPAILRRVERAGTGSAGSSDGATSAADAEDRPGQSPRAIGRRPSAPRRACPARRGRRARRRAPGP